MASRVIPVSPFSLVVFGATGDLAKRKLFPALWRRLQAGQCPDQSQIIGVARTNINDAQFRDMVAKSVCDSEKISNTNPQLNKWLEQISYISADVESGNWSHLHDALANAPKPHLYYLALAPTLTANVCQHLASDGLLFSGQNDSSKQGGRLILEKPFGSNLTQARELNRMVAQLAPESDIYRIDHYLGKETVQNLMALRFANALWEPIWNAQEIDHVQITVAEDIGVEGRGDYYDRAGATRDMLQNHLLQLLCLTAMEPPPQYIADEVRDQKLKVLRSLRPLDSSKASDSHDLSANVALGQYVAGNGHAAYSDDIARQSNTETFVAVKCMIDNWRWAGVPFYLRTGKRLSARVSEIAVRFKNPPHSIFPSVQHIAGNTLAIRLQPQECITLHVNIKEPGPGGFRIVDAPLDMSFAQTLDEPMPDAYERLLMDVVRGDQTLFMRADELEAAWQWVMPLVEYAENNKPQPYACGSSGPEESLRLLHVDNRQWRTLGL